MIFLITKFFFNQVSQVKDLRLQLSLRFRKLVNRYCNLAFLPVFIRLSENHALRKLINLLLKQIEVLGHDLVSSLPHRLHLTLPSLHLSKGLIRFDYVQNRFLNLFLVSFDFCFG